MKKLLYILLVSCFISSCKEKMDEGEVALIGIVSCQRQPFFLPQTGLKSSVAAFSTSLKRVKGVALIETTDMSKIWQHPSWTEYGTMGPIITDDKGNAYTVHVPVINAKDKTYGKQNIIYRIDSKTAEMKPWVELPVTDSVSAVNPYSLLGLYFDCHARKIYASTVEGSDRDHQKGIIYAIDITTGEIIDQLKGFDAMGICVGGMSGEKLLYAGSSRNSDIYSVTLTADGKFSGKMQYAFSLEMLGPRGDDKARRIRFDKNGDMIILGVEFNYNLTAPAEKQETAYRFHYNSEQKKWEYIQNGN